MELRVKALHTTCFVDLKRKPLQFIYFLNQSFVGIFVVDIIVFGFIYSHWTFCFLFMTEFEWPVVVQGSGLGVLVKIQLQSSRLSSWFVQNSNNNNENL